MLVALCKAACCLNKERRDRRGSQDRALSIIHEVVLRYANMNYLTSWSDLFLSLTHISPPLSFSLCVSSFHFSWFVRLTLLSELHLFLLCWIISGSVGFVSLSLALFAIFFFRFFSFLTMPHVSCGISPSPSLYLRLRERRRPSSDWLLMRREQSARKTRQKEALWSLWAPSLNLRHSICISLSVTVLSLS